MPTRSCTRYRRCANGSDERLILPTEPDGRVYGRTRLRWPFPYSCRGSNMDDWPPSRSEPDCRYRVSSGGRFHRTRGGGRFRRS